jgi:hypothetical protein
MYGVMLVILMGDINIMLASLMILVNSPGYIFSRTNLRFFKNSMISRTLLSGSSTGKYQLSNLIGVENIKNLVPSSNKSVSLIMCLAHMLINKNGSAGRKHRHIVEVGLSLLTHTSMPLKYWDEAFLVATYLINCLPTKTLEFSSPLEHLFSKKPNYIWLRLLGVLAGLI